MTILNEIQKWSAKLSAWQQHAIAILFERPSPTAEELEEILVLLMNEHGIDDLVGIARRRLSEDQVARPAGEQSLVQLQALRNLSHVNALAPGKTLPLALSGLTVIYGDNGAGKSGYTRVLKKACRARDQAEIIRPNAYKHPLLAEAASADFDVLVDGNAETLRWADGKSPPPALSSIAIFDSRCARAYVDNQGDFAYVPYGLDIFEGLAKVCAWLKDRIAEEQRKCKPNREPLARLASTSTQAGSLAKNLSSRTSRAEVERLANVAPEEAERLALLARTLAEADPKRKMAELRLRAGRLDNLVQRIDAAAALLAPGRVHDLQALVEQSNRAKAIAEAAAADFGKLDTLQGTGSEPWVELFKAARNFLTSVHQEHDFPHVGPDERCPLCQNIVGDAGATRLAAFGSYIEREATKAAARARQAAGQAYKAIVEAPLDLAFDQTLAHDLEVDQELVAACQTLQQSLRDRRDGIRRAATPGDDANWHSVPDLAANPRERLATFATALREAATKLEHSQDPAARPKMQAELAELQARQHLAELKPVALELIDRLAHEEKLAACARATSTTQISRKSTDLTNTMATKEVAVALQEELRRLGVGTLRVAMEPSSTKAKATFKLVLVCDSGAVPQDILSEGEQRAIAIAAFLAEVGLENGRGGVVFDDPVSSLDHARRERVAHRLAAEALKRQVIVFTHDTYFLHVLMAEARSQDVPTKALTLNQTEEGYGVAEEGLPFAGATVAQRVGMLRTKQVECARRFKAGDQVGYRLLARDLYNDLRMAWERGVEEVLLNEVVLRFRRGVETNRLKGVAIEQSDLDAVTGGMGRCSAFTGHDGALIANVAQPTPDEMTKDIQDLETWRSAAEKRRTKR